MRNVLFAAGIAVFLISSAGCSSKGSGSQSADAAHDAFGRLSIDELDSKMADAKAGKLALFIYDNNHKERWQQSHIPGAKWLDSDKVTAADLPQDKNATLVFYCANEH
jgi:hypothetical protein